MNLNAKFILSEKKAIEYYEKAKEHSDVVSYSFKTNTVVGKVLEKKTDSMFSIHYIDSLKNLNNKSRILFFLQAATKKEFDELFGLGISWFVVDNLTDLDSLTDYISKNNKKITLFLRMRLKEHTVQTGKHFVYGLFSEQVNRLLPILRENKNIEKVGIHFHRKTQNTSEWGIKEEFIESIKPQNLKNIDYVNIGGGLPSVYKNYGNDLIEPIFKKINDFKAFLNINKIKMIIEPGRFIAAPAMSLQANITGIYNDTIIINASVFNSAMDTFIANIRLLVDGELKSGIAYTIKGCTPDSMDIFRYKVFLDNPKVGDKIVFLNAGAYNFSCDFCSLPKLKTIIIE
ncbi:MAG: decarboxylase [archaeon]